MHSSDIVSSSAEDHSASSVEPFAIKNSYENIDSTIQTEESSKGKSAKEANLRKQDVLMKCALAAVMETSEDGVVWFDETDRNSLIREPIDKARNRIARMREISRSESSLFNEHGHEEIQDKTDVRTSDKFVASGDKISNIEAIKTTDDKPTNTLVAHDDEGNGLFQLRRSSNVVTKSFKKGHSRSKSDQIGLPKIADIVDAEDGANEEKLSTSAPTKQFQEPRNF